VGFSGIMPTPMATTQDFANWVCGELLLPEYLLFVLRSMQHEFEHMTQGSTHQTIYMPDLKKLAIPLPPRAEQEAIVSRIRARIVTIDAAIADHERNIDLLAERRRTLVSSAVTRGIDPKAPMRESGFAAAGTMPAHWQVRRLKSLSPSISVGIVVTPAKYYVDAGVPRLRSFNVKPGLIDTYGLAFISAESNQLHAKSILHAGDLVSVRTGRPGTTAIVPQALEGANCIDILIVRRSPLIDSEFLCLFLNSDAAAEQFSLGSEGAIQQHFNVGTMRNLQVLCPPVAEQRQIVAFVREHAAPIDAAAEKTRRAIELLREYRQSLITAAVTGRLAPESPAS
jgi:type I restriction enzyme S subunit